MALVASAVASLLLAGGTYAHWIPKSSSESRILNAASLNFFLLKDFRLSNFSNTELSNFLGRVKGERDC